MTIANIKEQALNLSPLERLELAQSLLDSLVVEKRNDSIQQTQLTELKDRIQLFREGKMKTISQTLLHQRINKKYGFSA